MASSDASAASAAAAPAPAPAALSAEEKSLKVKVNVVLRLEKELLRYGEEATAQAAVVAGMRARDADEHDVRKQVEVLAEAEMMVPDTARRLQKAVEDLDAHMVRAQRVRRRAGPLGRLAAAPQNPRLSLVAPPVSRACAACAGGQPRGADCGGIGVVGGGRRGVGAQRGDAGRRRGRACRR